MVMPSATELQFNPEHFKLLQEIAQGHLLLLWLLLFWMLLLLMWLLFVLAVVVAFALAALLVAALGC